MDKATELLAETVARLRADNGKFTTEAIASLKELLETRFQGMDKAVELMAANVRAVPSDLDKSLHALREVLRGEIRNVEATSLEKFDAVAGTFASNALALTAALAAQKEAAAESVKSSTLAIDRANAATKETIAANAAQTLNSLAAQAAITTDLKDRVVRIEAGGVGQKEERREHQGERQDSRQVMSILISAVSAVIAIAAVIVLVVIH